MQPRRLRLLVELSARGTMRSVAEATGFTTSTVSQQLAALQDEAGVELFEPVGRLVRLTPAGRRLVRHAHTILGAIEAAHAELDDATDPSGDVRVAGFASSVRRGLIPAVSQLCESHPAVRLHIEEREPDESFALLRDDAVDIALVYDYNVAPRTFGDGLATVPLWETRFDLAVPMQAPLEHVDLAAFRDTPWIVNSRGSDDESAVCRLCGTAGYAPMIRHYVDSLALVQQLVVAGLGVGLLAETEPRLPGVTLLPVNEPPVTQRAYACTRIGRDSWPPVRLVLERLQSGVG